MHGDGTVVASGAQDDAKQPLRGIAERLMWWQPPARSLEQTRRFIVQVMVLGTWEDVKATQQVYGEGAFREALRDAPPGIFDVRSWSYWHHVFGMLPVPALPRRKL